MTTMQRVNLYRPELRPSKEWLTAQSIALSAVGFSLLLVLSVILMNNSIEDLKRHVATIEAQKTESEARVARIKNMPRAGNAFQIDRRLKRLKRSVLAREQIGQIIQGQNLGNEAGFSGAMNSLAEHAFESISLEHIRISRGGSFVEMKGVTRSAQDVPLYLARLKKEDSFLGAQFGLLSVGKNDKRQSVHAFSLGLDSVYQLASKENGGGQ